MYQVIQQLSEDKMDRGYLIKYNDNICVAKFLNYYPNKFNINLFNIYMKYNVVDIFYIGNGYHLDDWDRTDYCDELLIIQLYKPTLVLNTLSENKYIKTLVLKYNNYNNDRVIDNDFKFENINITNTLENEYYDIELLVNFNIFDKNGKDTKPLEFGKSTRPCYWSMGCINFIRIFASSYNYDTDLNVSMHIKKWISLNTLISDTLRYFTNEFEDTKLLINTNKIMNKWISTSEPDNNLSELYINIWPYLYLLSMYYECRDDYLKLEIKCEHINFFLNEGFYLINIILNQRIESQPLYEKIKLIELPKKM